MKQLYNVNGLVFWSEKEIQLREMFRDYFAREVKDTLLAMNPAWQFQYFEGPLLTPRTVINQNYTNHDIWVQETAKVDVDENNFSTELVLRPETTPASYAYAQHLLTNHEGHKPPICVWQAGKSFRREIEQPTKHMRLKEFYQQEFQCIYTSDTLNDYHAGVIEPVRQMISDMVKLPTRVVESDRLPSYSLKTMDVEVDNGDKWMEVCSISLRTDFPDKAKFQTKKGLVEKDLLVVEIAIGLCRTVYNAIVGQKA